MYAFAPKRMLLYFAVYASAAYAFFWTMVKPWQDNFINGVESSFAVTLIGKLVILLNFGIQTAVMIDVERFGNFTRVAKVDQITLTCNTVLLLITNFYLVAQECYRPGVRWDLSAPDKSQNLEAWWAWQRLSVQSIRTERLVGESLAKVMTEQIVMLYILGEVAKNINT